MELAKNAITPANPVRAILLPPVRPAMLLFLGLNLVPLVSAWIDISKTVLLHVKYVHTSVSPVLVPQPVLLAILPPEILPI